MSNMMKWVPEQTRNGPRPAMYKAFELVPAKLEENNLEIDRLKDLGPEKQEERHRLITMKELAVRQREKEVRISILERAELERLEKLVNTMLTDKWQRWLKVLKKKVLRERRLGRKRLARQNHRKPPVSTRLTLVERMILD